MGKVIRGQRRTPRQLISQAREAAARNNLEAATDAAEWARQVVPVDTGALKGTIEAEANPDGSATYSAGGPDAPYAPAVNYGHATANGGYVAGQPFFDEGIEHARGESRERAARLKPYR